MEEYPVLAIPLEGAGATATKKARLRVGLLIDSFFQPRWVHKIVADIAHSTVAEIVLIIKNEAGGAQKDGWREAARKLLAKRQHILWKAYSILDDRLCRSRPDPFEKVDIRPLLGDCPVLPVLPRQTKFSDYFPEEAVAAACGYDLDVAFRFGFRILKGEALTIANYGVWSYHHGDNLVNRGMPAGFWEVMLGEPVTGSILQVLSPQLDGGRVLYRSWSATEPLSVRKNKERYYWKSTGFALRKLQELHEIGPVALDRDPFAGTYSPYSYRLYKAPTNLEMSGFLLKLAGRLARQGVRQALYQKQWLLAYKLGPTPGMATSFYNFKLIQPPKDRLWADPFPVEHEGKYYIFIEELLYGSHKGHISVIEMDEKGSWREPARVLETAHHLSYPFVFQWRGETYMIPESAASGSITLYRCRSFPFEWEVEAVLMEGVRAYDTTLVEIDGRWWMFTNICIEGASPNDELYLFYADSPLGPWQPHAGNPVKSDVRSARSAGKLFLQNGQLYRPAQDASVAYGYAIGIQKITCLTPREFAEEEVGKILPQWNRRISRNHTINNINRLTVMDGFMYRRRFF